VIENGQERSMKYWDFFRLVAVVLISGFVFNVPAQAAPQILAVLATDAAIPFTCKDGLCSAELSTYCLQRERPEPKAGTIYHPAAAKHFTLNVKTASGRLRNIPAAEHVTFMEARGFTTITAVIEKRQLKRLGSLDASISISKNASMLPAPEAGDPNPLSEQEIAYATDALRQFGQGMVDDKPGATAARLLTRVLNRMPDHGPEMPGISEKLWREAIGRLQTEGTGFEQAREVYNDCFAGPEEGAYGVGVRRCLEFRHDDLIRKLNIDYWNALPNS
jgi:hypothetical protein